MKRTLLVFLATYLGLGLAACSHLDTTPRASADRVLTGVVSNNTNAELPANSEVTVRVMDVSQGESRAEVLGEQTIENPGHMPVIYRIEFHAEDALLSRGVNVEARISVGGHLRYTTTSAHPVTLGNVNDSHPLEVTLTAKH